MSYGFNEGSFKGCCKGGCKGGFCGGGSFCSGGCKGGYGSAGFKGKGTPKGSFKGSYYGSEDHMAFPPHSEISILERIPKAAQKLSDMRESLSEDAMRAYRALQIALQRYSTPNAAQQDFERDFTESLQALFPSAWDIRATQIGSSSQWEVRIDEGESMFCSVRLEVLSDDSSFTRELKAKAKAVKDLLLQDGGLWKKTLMPEHGSIPVDSLKKFQSECKAKLGGPGEKGSRSGGGAEGGRGNEWQEKKEMCTICNRPLSEDLLNGEHMCIVNGTFQCTECGNTWSSFHARRRPSGNLMGQQCAKCMGNGSAKDWRVVTEVDRAAQRERRMDQPAGMHQAELCDACRTFGNCMGVFHDPFVITMALSLLSGRNVQWASFSVDMPELLIANLADDKHVCLQPHVFSGSITSETPKGGSKGAGGGKGKNPGFKGGGKDVGGVKDQRLVDNLVSGRGGKAASKGKNKSAHTGSLGPAGGSSPSIATRPDVFTSNTSFMQSHDYLPYGSESSAAALGQDGAAPGEGLQRWYTSEASEAPSESGDSQGLSRKRIGAQQSVDVTNVASATPSLTAVIPTPGLDALGRIRKAQFLHHVAKYLRSTGRPESEKVATAEDMLAQAENYEKACLKLKTMIPGNAAFTREASM